MAVAIRTEYSPLRRLSARTSVRAQDRRRDDLHTRSACDGATRDRGRASGDLEVVQGPLVEVTEPRRECDDVSVLRELDAARLDRDARTDGLEQCLLANPQPKQCSVPLPRHGRQTVELAPSQHVAPQRPAQDVPVEALDVHADLAARNERDKGHVRCVCDGQGGGRARPRDDRSPLSIVIEVELDGRDRERFGERSSRAHPVVVARDDDDADDAGRTSLWRFSSPRHER